MVKILLVNTAETCKYHMILNDHRLQTYIYGKISKIRN